MVSCWLGDDEVVFSGDVMAESQHRGDLQNALVHSADVRHLHVNGIDADLPVSSALRTDPVVGGSYGHQDLVVLAAEKPATLALQCPDNFELAAIDSDGLTHRVPVAEKSVLEWCGPARQPGSSCSGGPGR